MSDETKPERTHLPVLPHSGKVDQLRREAAMSGQTPVDAAGDRAAEAAPPVQIRAKFAKCTLGKRAHGN